MSDNDLDRTKGASVAVTDAPTTVADREATQLPAPEATGAVPATGRRHSGRRILGSSFVLLPLSFVVLIAAWYAYIEFGDVPTLLLPPPHSILDRFLDGLFRAPSDSAGLLFHSWITLQEVAAGLVLGVVGGMLLAILMTEIRAVERVLSPYIMAFQALPKIAVAPLFLLWFGFGMSSKVAVAVVLVFFPMLINTVAGLKGVDPDQAELMRMLKASRLKELRMVKLPFALPHIFAGLRIAIVMALVGAIVGEFIGGRHGLGALLLTRQAFNDVAGVFAIFIILCGMGAIGYGIVGLAEKRFLFWARRVRVDSGS